MSSPQQEEQEHKPNQLNDEIIKVDDDDSNNDEKSLSEVQTATTTKVLHTSDGAPYVICESKGAFVNPTITTPQAGGSGKATQQLRHGHCPARVVDQLNVDLGQKLITRNNRTLLWANSWTVFSFNGGNTSSSTCIIRFPYRSAER